MRNIIELRKFLLPYRFSKENFNQSIRFVFQCPLAIGKLIYSFIEVDLLQINKSFVCKKGYSLLMAKLRGKMQIPIW